MAKISIVIPVYNGENQIESSLNSVLSQKHKDYEVIIVDDGSTDKTSKVVNEYVKKNKNIKYIYQKNAGVAAARNKGIDNSTGEYITFLDADDFWDKCFLQEMIQEIKRENADICYCGYKEIHGDKINIKKSTFIRDNVLENYLKNKVNIHTTGWLISKKMINNNNIRFLEGVSWGEDIEFFAECLANANKVTYVKDYLTNYRVDFSDTQLSSFSIDKIDKDYESIKRMLNNKKINNNKEIEQILLGYRLPALIVYRLYKSIKLEINIIDITRYYNKYKDYLEKIKLNNGLRSLKLKIYYKLLSNRIK